MLHNIKLLIILISVNVSVQGQQLEVIHNITSDNLYKVNVEGGEKLLFYLNFSEAGVIDYSKSPTFYINGWYSINDKDDNTTKEKRNLTGIYSPYDYVQLYHNEKQTQKTLHPNDDNSLSLDTIEYLEKFYFPLKHNSKKISQASWEKRKEKIVIDKINFDSKSVYHKLYLKGDWPYNQDKSIDITDFVVAPFGENDIFLEDFRVDIHNTFKDSLGNWHVLLHIINEYVVPSSLSSGGYYYIMLDDKLLITKTQYIETYNQGKYISYLDNTFSHDTKQRFIVLSDWYDSKIIGSFFINNAKIEIEKEWLNH